MWYNAALQAAKHHVAKTGEAHFVVYDPAEEESGDARRAYYVATALDLDTFYAGAEVVEEVFP